MESGPRALSAQEACERIDAALSAIEAGQQVLRDTCSELTDVDFHIAFAERLEHQERINRGLMYRVFGELCDPPDSADIVTKVRDALWARLHITPAEIKRRCRTANRIRPRHSISGAPIAPEFPELSAAVESGAVGEDHIRVVFDAVDALPQAVSPDDVVETECTLVAHSTKLDSALVKKLGQRIADYLNPDGEFSDEDRQRRRKLHLGPQGPDGMSRLSGLLDPEARAYLEALTAAVRPGRHLPENPDADPEERDTRTASQRCHDALKLGLSAALESGTLGQHRGNSVTVVVTTTLAELDAAAHAVANPDLPMPGPARTGGGSRLPMRDLITMASGAIHYLAVFDDHMKRPLYLGRKKRVASSDQRLICHARDRGCTRPNCTAPGYHCEVHHARDWAAGGRTDADQLFFACPTDHRSVTRGDQRTVVTRTGRLGWTDGTGPPQINHAHHPDELLRGDPDPPAER
ncbi:HNH nuclease [Mycolicibacillus koreensis]|nr:HNH nuclease [Mycolicibacillus koreensis]